MSIGKKTDLQIEFIKHVLSLSQRTSNHEPCSTILFHQSHKRAIVFHREQNKEMF